MIAMHFDAVGKLQLSKCVNHDKAQVSLISLLLILF